MATKLHLRRKLTRSSYRPLFERMEDRRLLATWTVDDNFIGVGCDTSDRRCETIQDAVDAANSGDTVKVKAGTYNEDVDVGKKLTIVASGNATVDPVDTDAGALDGAVAYGFFLHANDIVIKGFNIQDNSANGDGSSDADDTIGIGTSNAFSGYKIQNNTIQGNSFGIYLNTTTSNSAHRTEVTGNVIRDNDQGFGVQAAAGNGIYSDQGARNILISKNTFRGQDNDDILFTNAGVAGTPLQINITVKGNSFLNSGNGPEFIGVQRSEISGNVMRSSNFNGIQLSGGNVGISIKNNTMKNPGTQGFSGIRLLDGYGVGDNSNIVITGNTIQNAGLTGIRMADTDNSVIRGNTILGSKGFDLSVDAWGNGISLENSSNNTVDGNTLKLNARDGLFVDGDSTGNLIKNNVSFANAQRDPAGFDYFDESVGGGTAGTGNTYKNNAGHTDSPHGLIKHHI